MISLFKRVLIPRMLAKCLIIAIRTINLTIGAFETLTYNSAAGTFGISIIGHSSNILSKILFSINVDLIIVYHGNTRSQ